jgi:hypothetical protein
MAQTDTEGGSIGKPGVQRYSAVVIPAGNKTTVGISLTSGCRIAFEDGRQFIVERSQQVRYTFKVRAKHHECLLRIQYPWSLTKQSHNRRKTRKHHYIVEPIIDLEIARQLSQAEVIQCLLQLRHCLNCRP